MLSGGSIRAAAHSGVIKAMEEYGLQPEIVVGCSGGAIVGAMYACGMNASEIQDVFISYSNKKGKLIDVNYLEAISALLHRDIGRFTGFIHGNNLKRLVGQHLGNINTFHKLSQLRKADPSRYKDLFIIAVNLLDGMQTIFNTRFNKSEINGYRVCKELQIDEAVRASASIPGIFKPFVCTKRQGNKDLCSICKRDRDRFMMKSKFSQSYPVEYYVDGGIRDYYPISVAVKLAGACRVLGVNLGYEGMRRGNVVNGGLPEILSQVLDIYEMDQYAAALADKDIYSKSIVTLNPEIYDVSTFEVERSAELIQRGYEKAIELFEEKDLRKGEEYRNHNMARLFSRC